jgi:hypothetical protein
MNRLLPNPLKTALMCHAELVSASNSNSEFRIQSSELESKYKILNSKFNAEFSILNFKLSKTVSTFIIGLISLGFTLISPVHAQDTSCRNIYGGGELCKTHPDLSINMQVQEPDTAQFREALNAESNYYAPGGIVTFRISVTNTSSKDLSDIDVSYTFPPYTTGGNKTNTFTRNIPSLGKGQTTVFTTQTRIVTEKLPLSSPVCLTSHAEVTYGGKVGSDITPFCIDNTKAVASAQTNADQSGKGLPVYNQTGVVKTPATGPETLTLLGSIVSIFGGFILRKKSYLLTQ